MKSKIMNFIGSVGLLLLASCQSHPKNDISNKIVKINTATDPQSLDPRLERGLESTTILHALYEGLMRTNLHGEPVPAIAEKMNLSPDQKTYIFTLKKTFWTNGDPLTSDHFVSTWKEILKPDFPAPNAYQYYIIKGAKAAKEGKISLDDIGIQNPDPWTLIVELEAPTPYFLELLTTHFFYPVHPQFSSQNRVTNGPFKVENWQKQRELSLVKNSTYWDADQVQLEKIIFMPLDEFTALKMFQNGEIQWSGSPMASLPQDAIASLKHQHLLRVAPAAGTYWFRINTEKKPFQSEKMRKAFAQALDRKAIVDHVLQGNQKPAFSIVPPSLLNSEAYFSDKDTPKAWFLFQEALEEMRISKDNLPTITLCYANNPRNKKIAQAVQQQWNKTFNIELELENCEAQIFYDRLHRQDYQMALGSWFADFQDPINFLEIFKSKVNSTNNTLWENAHYTQLLNQSSFEFVPSKRKEILLKAEALLMHEMPVIPLFFNTFNYVKEDTLFGVYFSDLGYLDFKYAFYEG